MAELDDSTKKKLVKLLRILDVANIPCAQDSVFRIRRSYDVGVGGFILVTQKCWLHCRYNYAKLRIQKRIAREGIKNKILNENTHLDSERKQTYCNRSS
ncbi:unnamed protein product [Nyctereutes procyonoides]|uniref:Cytochrome c oxidase assembly protein COX20, mitochondrial n=1 Tax=Nyctereutes procyonoides TaxID=34880 RepID=A0A811Z6Y1_NYCPR|nr:unnamed protein product [Nyctereutes procyonoides]